MDSHRYEARSLSRKASSIRSSQHNIAIATPPPSSPPAEDPHDEELSSAETLSEPPSPQSSVYEHATEQPPTRQLDLPGRTRYFELLGTEGRLRVPTSQSPPNEANSEPVSRQHQRQRVHQAVPAQYRRVWASGVQEEAESVPALVPWSTFQERARQSTLDARRETITFPDGTALEPDGTWRFRYKKMRDGLYEDNVGTRHRVIGHQVSFWDILM